MSGAGERSALSSAAEVTLVMLAARGDDEAFSELVRRRQSWLRSLLRRLCRDGAEADDLSQQVFVTAWKQLPRLNEPAAFGGWLRRIAVNVWLQFVRARGGHEMESDPATIDAQVVLEADPSSAMDLDRVLSRLRSEERVCVVLCHAEGMSHTQIAAATGWPLGTVKSHVARGSARLRELLGEEFR